MPICQSLDRPNGIPKNAQISRAKMTVKNMNSEPENCTTLSSQRSKSLVLVRPVYVLTFSAEPLMGSLFLSCSTFNTTCVGAAHSTVRLAPGARRALNIWFITCMLRKKCMADCELNDEEAIVSENTLVLVWMSKSMVFWSTRKRVWKRMSVGGKLKDCSKAIIRNVRMSFGRSGLTFLLWWSGGL